SSPVINIKSNQITISNFTILASEFTKPTGTYQYDEATYPKTAIKLENSYFCNITNNIIKNSGTAIWLFNATNNTLVSNIVSENFFGITLTDSSSNNTISKNSLTNNLCAMQLFGTGSIISHNMIKQNYIAYNEQGLSLQDALSDNYPEDDLPNYIVENLIEYNEAGISLMDSQGNFIYNNNFVGNIRQVTDAAPVAIVSFSVNVWDNGTTGNYWSNYNGTGNMSYIINEYNKDNYPMLIPFEIPIENFPSFLPNSPSPTQILSIPPILDYPFFLILLIVLLCILVIGLLRKKRYEKL
ncbi:MAG: hypothetical protein GX638_12550, partial [Crenarchaeota archaeon]|nr:hypothetical protein [Thermoproteota archaeon]